MMHFTKGSFLKRPPGRETRPGYYDLCEVLTLISDMHKLSPFTVVYLASL